jgi:hypothetical protein
MAKRNLNPFIEEVISAYSQRITDEVFLMIENDRELLHRYLRLVSDTNLDTVNKMLGKKIKINYKLKNTDKQENPKSKLIKSYTEH